MKAVIVEDEIVAAQSLQRLIAQADSGIEIVAVLRSVEESAEWFSANPAPDLVFMDIHLSDGSSFSIFEKVSISAPVVFTTAYDEYALKAFEVNSVDYLLKPVDMQHLKRAIEKLGRFKETKINHEDMISSMLSMLRNEKPVYKSNFLIPHKDKYIPLSVNDIAYIFSEHKIARIVTIDNRTFYEHRSLDDMQRQIDPSEFFRANRQYIVSRRAIKDVSLWFDSKLSVNLVVEIPEKMIVSRVRAAEFKEWYTGK